MTDCILWTGAVNNKGYGLMNAGGKVELVHRLAFKLSNPRKRIDRKLVLHRCDVRLCINAEHLFAGTAQENTDDIMRKGRWKKPSYNYGENHHNSKLTWKDVRAIRRSYKFGVRGSGAKELATKYGVSKPLILGIVTGKSWTEDSK